MTNLDSTKQKGPSPPCTPEQQQWGTLMEDQNPNRQSPEGETTGGPERVGPRPQHPRGPFGFVPVSQSPHAQPWTPQTPPSPIHELLPRLVFQGSGGRQKGPMLRMRTPADGDEGNRGIPAEPEKGKGGTTPQMDALGWFVRLGDEDPRGWLNLRKDCRGKDT